MGPNREIAFEKKRMWLALIPSIVFVIVLWVVFILNYSGALGDNLFRFGILPRHAEGLVGIILSPFIHGSLSHLFSNTFPVVILLWSLFYFYTNIAARSLAYMWLLSGLFTWAIGRESYHIGASGLIFSMVFFLFFSGIIRKYIPLIAVSLAVAFIYGSMVWSIFPFAEYVDTKMSWEGHLSGAMSGFIVALFFRKKGPQKPPEEWIDETDEAEHSEDPERNFFTDDPW